MSAMTAYFILPMLPYDFESAKLSHGRAKTFFLTLNQSAESRLAPRLAKRVEFLALAFGDQLDAAIVEIAHRARDFETGCDRLHRVAKPDSLHATRIKNRHSLAAHGQTLRGGDQAQAQRNAQGIVWREMTPIKSTDEQISVRTAICVHQRPSVV